MALTHEDKIWIKDTIIEVIQTLVTPRLDELEASVRALQLDMISVKTQLALIDGRLEAVEADVKELYYLQAGSAPSVA